ncbi:MAG: DNA/RNA non-specific endonuclease [Bacteroidia bacterium]|nr:DNA/RNA non-specific endonuclease [Bacteroidia bacterium]
MKVIFTPICRPQVADLNRGAWARLEDMLRAYIAQNASSQLYVVTGPVLRDGLPWISRSVNQVSIPEYFFKVVLDLDHAQGIAFLMPNRKIEYPVEHYAVSIDEVEKLTGIDFFPALDDEQEERIEARKDPAAWLPSREQGDALPLDPTQLPRNTFNTVQAKIYAGKGEDITVCGTVVSTKNPVKAMFFKSG